MCGDGLKKTLPWTPRDLRLDLGHLVSVSGASEAMPRKEQGSKLTDTVERPDDHCFFRMTANQKGFS